MQKPAYYGAAYGCAPDAPMQFGADVNPAKEAPPVNYQQIDTNQEQDSCGVSSDGSSTFKTKNSIDQRRTRDMKNANNFCGGPDHSYQQDPRMFGDSGYFESQEPIGAKY